MAIVTVYCILVFVVAAMIGIVVNEIGRRIGTRPRAKPGRQPARHQRTRRHVADDDEWSDLDYIAALDLMDGEADGDF